MWIQSVCWLVCLLVTLVTHNHGIQFSMTRSPNNYYCGYLQCSANISQTEKQIHTLIGLTISDIVQGSTHLRLASVSVFDKEPQVETTRVLTLNATGNMSRYHGNLTIALRDDTNCQFGSFLCELTFVSDNGQSGKVSEILASDKTEMCDQLHSDNAVRRLADMDEKLAMLDVQNTVTGQELAELGRKLDNVLRYLDRLVAMVNNSQQSENNFSCVSGAPHDDPRQKFLLWGRVPALCDTETDGGGWVIIQRRTKGDVDFNRGWNAYKKGFGTPDTDYWLGNDNIHNLTSQGYTNLRVDMEYQGVKYFAEYSTFSVADEISKYKLTVGGYHGTAGDGLTYNSGMFFSTFDNDNDDTIHLNCAAADDFHGAWWYKSCSLSNLNGFWGAQNKSGLIWLNVLNPRSLTWSEMKIRQV